MMITSVKYMSFKGIIKKNKQLFTYLHVLSDLFSFVFLWISEDNSKNVSTGYVHIMNINGIKINNKINNECLLYI